MPSLKPLWIILIAVLTLGIARPAWALDPKVNDSTSLFSPAAIDQANQVIAQIEHRFAKDVVVEVLPAIPDDIRQQHPDVSRSELFSAWVNQRTHELGVNGVYILICRDPFHVEVGVDPVTERNAFTADDRDHVRDILVGAFRQKDYDQGLSQAMDFINSTMTANWNRTHGGNNSSSGAPGYAPYSYSGPRSSGGGISSFACLAIGILALVVIASAVRRLFGGGYGSGYGGPGYGGGYGGYGGYGGGFGGGGGFLSSLFGGAIGGAAGSYLENRFDQRGGGGGFGQSGGGGSGPAQDNSTWGSGAGQDFNSSGGDVGGFGGGGGGDIGGGGGSSGGDV